MLYEQFVATGTDGPSPWRDLIGGMYLGGEAFMQRVQAIVSCEKRSAEHVRAQRVVRCATVSEVETAMSAVWQERGRELTPRALRMAFGLLGREEALGNLGELGSVLGVGATGVSYLIGRARRQFEKDEAFRSFVAEVRERIRNCRLQM